MLTMEAKVTADMIPNLPLDHLSFRELVKLQADLLFMYLYKHKLVETSAIDVQVLLIALLGIDEPSRVYIERLLLLLRESSLKYYELEKTIVETNDRMLIYYYFVIRKLFGRIKIVIDTIKHPHVIDLVYNGFFIADIDG